MLTQIPEIDRGDAAGAGRTGALAVGGERWMANDERGWDDEGGGPVNVEFGRLALDRRERPTQKIATPL
jgi:hypothetical protein